MEPPGVWLGQRPWGQSQAEPGESVSAGLAPEGQHLAGASLAVVGVADCYRGLSLPGILGSAF